VSDTKIRFETPAITLTSKVIDGTFPDYTRVIPQANPRRLEVDAKEFAQAVDRVATVSSERSRAVKLNLDEDRLILSVNAPDAGTAEEELAVGPMVTKSSRSLQRQVPPRDRATKWTARTRCSCSKLLGRPTVMREGTTRRTSSTSSWPMRV
jgi:DNA polymerase-3 subunit beta